MKFTSQNNSTPSATSEAPLVCKTSEEKPLVDEKGGSLKLLTECYVYNNTTNVMDSMWWWNGTKWIKY